MSLAKKSLIGLAVLLLLAVITTAVTAKVILGHDKIVQGVYAGQVELSALSKQEAQQALKALEKELWKRTTRVEVYGENWEVAFKDLGVQLEIPKMVEQAYQLGRDGSLLAQYQMRKTIAYEGREVNLVVKVDQKTMERKLSDLTKQLITAPVNASISITPTDQVVLVPGKQGVGIDTAGIAEQLKRVIEEKVDEPRIALTMKATDPVQKLSDLEAMRIKALVSQFSTRFDASQGNRSYNILVAAGALDGLIVKPGETISFNEIVGPRSSEAGYREAPVIVNKKLVPGIGGGVCQVSTTLYNSLLKGNFSVVSRRPHSFPASYVPVGRDATVTYGGIDFKFKNNRSSYMYIKSEVVGSRLSFKLFADPAENKEVEIIDRIELEIPYKTVYERDPNLPQGKQVVKEKGRKGYRTTTVRLIKEKGIVVTREVVTKSYYKPINQVIVIGTGAPNQPTNLNQPIAPTAQLDNTQL